MLSVLKKTLINNNLALIALTVALNTGCDRHSQNQFESQATIVNQAKKELVRGNLAEPTSLDPQIGIGNEIFIIRDLHEGLVSLSSEGKILPAAAERWETRDGLVYTFFLRKDAYWSNGDPVTAHDFVFSWRRLTDPETGAPYGWYLGGAGVKNATEINLGSMPPESLGVAAIDDHTLQVTLAKPVAYFLDMLVHKSTFPVHPGTIKQYGDNWAKQGQHVGNGPFKLSKWVVNERIELVPNTYYWDRESVRLEKVTFLPISDPGAELQRYLAGEIDITYRIPGNQTSRLLEARPNELKLDPFLGTGFILFNMQKPPFDDVRLRKALAYAVDREIITEKVINKGEIASYTLIPPGYLDEKSTQDTWKQWPQNEREARARALYREAGYSIEDPLEVTFLGAGNFPVAIASMWKQVLGINTSIETQEFKSFLKTLESGNFQVATGVWWGDYNEPSTMLKLLLADGGTNFSGYRNKEYDALIQTSKYTANIDQRLKFYAQAESLLAEDMPISPLFQFTSARLVKTKIGGYKPHPLNYLASKDLWLRSDAD